MPIQKEVTIVRGYHGYVPGDVARFDPEEADALVAKGLATAPREVAVAEAEAAEIGAPKDKSGKGDADVAVAPKGESK